MEESPTRVSRAPHHLLATLAEGGIRPGLETTRAHLEALGRPHHRYRSVVVAGTNGKGACAAVLASIAHAAGYRVGLYTSPHLEEFEERIRVDDVAIEAATLADLLEEIFALSEARDGISRPTSYEALTLAALLHFHREKVDLAVLEVGMGGRLDAVNVVEPVVSVVTEVALEHRRWLGDSVASIAAEKAAVAREGRPLVISLLGAESGAAVARAARRYGAEITALGREVELEVLADGGLVGQRLAVDTGSTRHELVTTLAGAHQARNVALAVAAAERLADRGFPSLGRASIEAGVARCRWPGRLEEVLLPNGARVVLDGAHNPAAVTALAAVLVAHVPDHDLLFGCLADKDAAAMLPRLAETAVRVTLTAPVSERARSAASLLPLLGARHAAGVAVEPVLGRALDRALEGLERPLVVTGSLALVGPVRHRLRRRFGVPPPATEPLF